jgi:hypothetical protein
MSYQTKHVIIDRELHERLRKAAAEEGRHMRHLVERAVRDDLKRRELVRPRERQS